MFPTILFARIKMTVNKCVWPKIKPTETYASEIPNFVKIITCLGYIFLWNCPQEKLLEHLYIPWKLCSDTVRFYKTGTCIQVFACAILSIWWLPLPQSPAQTQFPFHKSYCFGLPDPSPPWANELHMFTCTLCLYQWSSLSKVWLRG